MTSHRNPENFDSVHILMSSDRLSWWMTSRKRSREICAKLDIDTGILER